MQSVTLICERCGKTLDVAFDAERHAIVVAVCDCVQSCTDPRPEKIARKPSTSDAKRQAATRSWRYRMRKKGVSESEISRLESLRDANVTHEIRTVTHHESSVTRRDAYRDESRQKRDATVTQRDAHTHTIENNNKIINTINTNTSLSSETVTHHGNTVTQRDDVTQRDAHAEPTKMRERSKIFKSENFEIREAVQNWTPPTLEDAKCSVEDFRDVLVKLATLDAGYLAYARNQQDVAFNGWFCDLASIPHPWLLRAIGSYYAERRKPDFQRPDPLHLSLYMRNLARTERDRDENERQRVLAEIQRETPERLTMDFTWSKEQFREHLLKLPPILREIPWKKWHEKRGIMTFEPITTKEYSR